MKQSLIGVLTDVVGAGLVDCLRELGTRYKKHSQWPKLTFDNVTYQIS